MNGIAQNDGFAVGPNVGQAVNYTPVSPSPVSPSPVSPSPVSPMSPMSSLTTTTNSSPPSISISITTPPPPPPPPQTLPTLPKVPKIKKVFRKIAAKVEPLTPTWSIVISVILIVAIVAGLGVGGYFLWRWWKKQNPSSSQSDSSPQPAPVPTTCAKGSTLDGTGKCVAAPAPAPVPTSCAKGTTLDGTGKCVPAPAPVPTTCAKGTTLDGTGKCVPSPAPAPATCAKGTTLDGTGRCVPSPAPSPATCKKGTTLDPTGTGKCVKVPSPAPSPATCKKGTTLDPSTGKCVKSGGPPGGPPGGPSLNISTSPPAAGWPSSTYVKATVPTDAGARFQIGDSRLKAKGSKSNKTPIVMKEGLMAYEVTYPPQDPHKSNMNITFTQPGYFPSTQARFRFKIFPDPAWPWTSTSGKLAGFAIGKGASSGGDYSTNGASVRLSWDDNGGLSPYVYPELHQALHTLKSHKKVTPEQLDQDPSFYADVPKGAQSGISPAGTHMWHPRKGGQNSYALAFVRGRWNQIELYVKLNTPGKYDGIIEYSINGKTVRFEKMRLRYDSSSIESVQIHTFFGGGKDMTPHTQVKMWYADFEFYKT